MEHPHAESHRQPRPAVSETEMRIALCKLLHSHETRFSSFELPACHGAEGALSGWRFLTPGAVPSGAPPAHTCDLHSFLLVTLQFKKKVLGCHSGGAWGGGWGGRRAQRARCQGRPDLHRVPGGDRAGGARRGQHSARAQVSARGSPHAQAWSPPRSAPGPALSTRAPHSLPRTRRPFPLGLERRPGSSRPGRASPRRGQSREGPEDRPPPVRGRRGTSGLPGRDRPRGAAGAPPPGRPQGRGTRTPRALLF